MTHKKTKLPFF